MDLTITTGDIAKWADKMEERGAEFASEVLKKVKKRHEKRRKQGHIKFSKIKRRKSGAKRFAIQKDSSRAAELINRNAGGHFHDIFTKD